MPRMTAHYDGKTTRVPGKYSVLLQFTPDGQFGANEPVNYHSGGYRVTPGGSTTSGLSNGDALTVTAGSYTLVAEKDGRQADF